MFWLTIANMKKNHDYEKKILQINKILTSFF